MDAIKKIHNEKLVENFIKKNNSPDDKEMAAFIKELRQKKINLGDRNIKRLIRIEMYKDNIDKAPIYDLDYDTQLKMGVQVLRAEISGIFKRH